MEGKLGGDIGLEIQCYTSEMSHTFGESRPLKMSQNSHLVTGSSPSSSSVPECPPPPSVALSPSPPPPDRGLGGRTPGRRVTPDLNNRASLLSLFVPDCPSLSKGRLMVTFIACNLLLLADTSHRSFISPSLFGFGGKAGSCSSWVRLESFWWAESPVGVAWRGGGRGGGVSVLVMCEEVTKADCVLSHRSLLGRPLLDLLWSPTICLVPTVA